MVLNFAILIFVTPIFHYVFKIVKLSENKVPEAFPLAIKIQIGKNQFICDKSHSERRGVKKVSTYAFFTNSYILKFTWLPTLILGFENLALVQQINPENVDFLAV